MHRRATLRHRFGRLDAWLGWLFGAALLATLITAALRYSEERAFMRLVDQARPWWLLASAVLQAGTYQGAIWRRVARAAGATVPWRAAVELGLAKLFADQALPSAGLSSSVLVAKALGQRGVPRPAGGAAVLVNIASYHLAYTVALVAALVLFASRVDVPAIVFSR